MIAAFATIAFLAAAWAAIVAIAGSLEGNLGKVSAALLRETPARALPPVVVRLSPRYPSARVQRASAQPEMRAAA